MSDTLTTHYSLNRLDTDVENLAPRLRANFDLLDTLLFSALDYRVEDYASLSAALTAIGTVNKVRLTCQSAITLTSNVSIPSNIVFIPKPGCLVSAASSKDLTVIGPLCAAPFQWIGANVNLKFVQVDNLTNTPIDFVFAEWWGAVGSDAVDDTASFNAALAAMKTSRGIALRLFARPYRASITIPAPANEAYPIVIVGCGDGSSIRTNSSSSPALSLDLGISDPNAKVLIRDVAFNGRGTMTVPIVSLKAQGGTTNRLYGVLDNIKVTGAGNLADAIYIRGALAAEVSVFTQEGRYSLYLDGCSNTIMRSIHAGNATCNGVMINGGGSNTILRARIEDSNTPNTRTVSTISGDGSTVTVVTTAAHNMETMDRATLSGNSGGYNFTTPRSITVVNSTTFTYAGAETGAGSGGTILISASALRIKNSSGNNIYDFANEGKTNLDYTVWIQSDGTSVGGTPSSSDNCFFGGEYAGVANTSRVGLSTVLLEGNCHGNLFEGANIGRSLPLNSNSWEIRHERNSSGLRPRRNRYIGSSYTGTGSSLNFKFYEEIDGAFGNYAELYDRATERVHIYGNRYKLSDWVVSGEVFIDENSAGQQLFTSGASATILCHIVFDSFIGVKSTTFINNSSQILRIDPHGSEKIGRGGAGEYLELAAGASAVLGCTVAGTWDVQFSSGSLSYEGDSLLSGLVAYWKLDEASGTRADSAGSNNLTDNNTVTQAAGLTGHAAQFTAANSESLSIADNAALSMGDIDCTFAALVYLDSKGAHRTILSKYASSAADATSDYLLFYSTSADRFRFQVVGSGGTPVAVNADALGSPSTGTWYLVIAWHDSVANTINIQVNDGLVNSVAHTLGVQDTSSGFALGRLGDFAGLYWDGRIGPSEIWKRVLSPSQRSALFASGGVVA